MEMLLYQSTQFRDVKKILDRAHGFAGLLTAGGIEASRLDVPFTIRFVGSRMRENRTFGSM